MGHKYYLGNLQGIYVNQSFQRDEIFFVQQLIIIARLFTTFVSFFLLLDRKILSRNILPFKNRYSNKILLSAKRTTNETS